jgi:hypothetical protein
MPEDTPQGEEQRTMLTFAEAAERLVEDKIAQSMTAEGLRRLARDPLSGWPIGPSDYRMAGKVRMLPYDLLAPYMRERLGKRRGRGPDTKKRGPKTSQQQGATPMTREEYEEKRRRLEADAEDAKKTYVRAKSVYDKISNELRDLRVAWNEQQKAEG